MPGPAGKPRPKKPTAGSNIRYGFESFKKVAIRDSQANRANSAAKRQGGGGAAAAVAAKEKASMATTLDWTAWKRIYHSLWSGTADADVQEALRALSDWQQAALRRREPSLFPAYASATLEVASVVMAGAPLDGPSDVGTSADVLVHAYAGAITRAVVELTERDSAGKAASGRAGASTYRERAAAIDLPTEVTEVRNLAAHGRNPPMAQLRWAAMVLLAYLRSEFWDVQRKQLGAVKEHQKQHAEDERAKDEEKRLAAVDRAAAATTTAGSSPALSLDALRSRLSGMGGAATSPAAKKNAKAVAAKKAITDWA